MAAEIWQQIKGKDWSLVGGGGTWNFTAPKPAENYTVAAFGFAEVPQ